MFRNDTSPPTTDADRSTAAVTGAVAEPEPRARRRLVLEALESLAGRATVDELVAELLATDREVVDDDAKTVRIRLHHVDLPRLAERDASSTTPSETALDCSTDCRGRPSTAGSTRLHGGGSTPHSSVS